MNVCMRLRETTLRLEHERMRLRETTLLLEHDQMHVHMYVHVYDKKLEG